jgi:hypothetical protein
VRSREPGFRRPRVARLLALAVLAFALPACTGTREATVPILLVIGSVGPDGPQLSLVQDVYDPGATTPRDLVPVAGSETDLPLPPVSLDVVDRTGNRGELVVLVSDGTDSRLHFFDLTGIDPGAPAALPASRQPVDIAAQLLAETGLPAVCPVEVAVGGNGRYVALLDDGSCRGDLPDLFVYDLTQEELVLSVSSEFPALELVPAGVFVDQSRDLLYFAVDSLNRVEIHSVPLAGSASTTTVGSAAVTTSLLGESELARASGGIAFLADDRLALVPLGGGDAAAGPITTLDGAVSLLEDPGGGLDEIVVFSSSHVAIHADPDDDDPETYSVRSAPIDTTLEPVQRFGYLLEVGGVEILDLFPYAERPASRLLFRTLPNLDEPRVITWVYSAEDPAAVP